jgi:hypothetical protein
MQSVSSTDDTDNPARQAQQSVKDLMTRQLDDRSTMAGEQVAALGQAMREMGTRLRSNGNEAPARISEEAAMRVERMGHYLRDTDGRRILTDIEDVGRGRPWLLAAAGMTAGVLGARFLKASRRNDGTRTTSRGNRIDIRPGADAASAWEPPPAGPAPQETRDAITPGASA